MTIELNTRERCSFRAAQHSFLKTGIMVVIFNMWELQTRAGEGEIYLIPLFNLLEPGPSPGLVLEPAHSWFNFGM